MTPALSPAPPQALTRLAAVHLPVLAGEPPAGCPALAEGCHVRLAVVQSPSLHSGTPFVTLNHHAAPTLIERPREGRLRILVDYSAGGWIEVALAPFLACLEEARAVYPRPLPDFTTIAIPAVLVLTAPLPRKVSL
jgi:hypothetical protein